MRRAAVPARVKTAGGRIRGVRIGGGAEGGFVRELDARYARMKSAYAGIMAGSAQTREIDVMIQDGTVKKDTTFDPGAAHAALSSITSLLGGWDVQDVDTTRNEDKRRIFTKFAASDGGYVLSGHLSLQYHVLLYYTPDQRVLDCQLELSKLVDATAGHEERRARMGDEIVRQRLELAGAQQLGEQEIFETLYNDETLRGQIASEMDAKADPEEARLAARKAELYRELDSRLLEVYKTSGVMIDEARLVGGEEGYVFTLDIERDGGGFDPGAVEQGASEAILARMGQLESALGRARAP